MASAQQQAQQAAMQNFQARQTLLSTGIAMTKRLQPVTGQLGSSIRIPLLRMGVMTGVLLQFTIPVTIAGFATASLLAPFNIAQQIKYTDFAGVNRTQTNGFQLWAAQSLKNADLMGAAPAMNYGGGAGQTYNYNTNILNFPQSNGAGTIQFSIYVPMAYDPATDLTGAILTQTNVGEHFITIQLPNSLVGADPYQYPYGTGATVTTTGVTVEAFQNYIQPQAMDAFNLPVQDLSTVYGFEGGYQLSGNIAAGQDTFINFPNNRAILSTLIMYEENGVFVTNETNINAVTLLANSNTNFREMTPRFIREAMRNVLNSDLPPSVYNIPSRRQPILTQLYANVQAKFGVTSAAAGVTQFISQFEVQYASGSPLPGITVAA